MGNFIDATQVQVAGGGAPTVVPQKGTTLDLQSQQPEPAQDANNTTSVVTDMADTANVTTLPTTADPTLTVGPSDQPVQD